MRRRRWNRGASAVLLLSSLTLVLTGCSTSDLESKLRFGFPTGVTKQAERVRVLWTWAGVSALALGVVVWGLIFWACIRYRKRKGTQADYIPRQTKYNIVIELVCVTLPFVIIVGLFWRTLVVQNYETKLSKNPDVMVRVDAFKWNWQFEYMKRLQGGTETTTAYPGHTSALPGFQGEPEYLNTVGSSTEVPVLVIPVNETVQFVEHSEDVIHSFWVPEFLFKRDVIPYGTAAQQKASGLQDNRFEITATHTGSYVGRCAELCGTYHSEMNFEVRVVTPTVFQNYLAALKKIGPFDPSRQSKALVMAHVPGGAYATTTHPYPTARTAESAVGG